LDATHFVLVCVRLLTTMKMMMLMMMLLFKGLTDHWVPRASLETLFAEASAWRPRKAEWRSLRQTSKKEPLMMTALKGDDDLEVYKTRRRRHWVVML